MIFIPQRDQMDCGPACIAMIVKWYGKNYTIEFLRDNSFISRDGVSLLGISEVANKIGFETLSVKLDIKDLFDNNKLFPVILHWNQNHFVVLYKAKKSFFSKERIYFIADPAHGVIKLSEERLKQSWCYEDNTGVAMFLYPSQEFEKLPSQKEEKISIGYLLGYLRFYKKQLILLTLLLLLGSGLTLIFPFLTETLIDKGVNAKNLQVIFIILLAQLSIFLGSITIEIFRNWSMLYIGTHLSIQIISDFLKKMLRLPIKFFDTKTMGDFNQRIQDNERIEDFLTSQSLTTFFSIITFSVFFGVLWYYNFTILLSYLALTLLSIGWSLFWLKRRKILDYYRFQQRSENQESIYEILNGITEMKLNNFECYKRKEWENIQKKMFNLNIRILKINQLQLSGFEFLNQLKNILVTFLAANYVVKGNMTLGMLLSISYIIGQMNSPINQLLNFFRSLQDAKLSLERLNEVRNKPNEEEIINKSSDELKKLSSLSENPEEIRLQNLSFQYEGPKSPFILENINLLIPKGKITAIVGASGSGKTSLMKLLLRFYEPTEGLIFYGKKNILELSPKSIRKNSGVVMQEGYIFSDTIERNIVMGSKNIDYDKLDRAIKTANIENFIKSLPLGLKTKIGASGNGISGGQKQRILIARAVYKDPSYIFFDEATSALDAENEMIIQNNLQFFFNRKTVVIIAHRLSTVKNADQIVVLDKGKIIELGNHQELIKKRGFYFYLIRNQLELGS